MALFGALLLIFIIFIRPQEFLPALQSLSILNVSSGIAALGIVIEMATGKLKSLWTPQLPFAFGFLAWCVVTLAMKVGIGTGRFTYTVQFADQGSEAANEAEAQRELRKTLEEVLEALGPS